MANSDDTVREFMETAARAGSDESSGESNIEGTGEEVQAIATIEVEMPDGRVSSYTDIELLREDARNGMVKKSYRARRISPGTTAFADGDAADDIAEGESDAIRPAWEPVGSLQELRSIYRPVWGTALDYIWPGILVGIALKILDTTVTIFSVDETAGLFWLFAIGCIVASARLGWVPIALYFLISFQYFDQIPNFFVTALVSAAVGALFGAPGGMVVGTVVGAVRARRLSGTVELYREGLRPYILGLALPATFLITALSLYIFWLTPMIIEMMA